MDDAALATLVREVAKRELGEDDETREQALTQFRDWIVKNPNIRNCRTDDNFLLAFLRARKFSIQSAQQSLLRLLNAMPKLSKFMEKLDCLDPKINIFYTNGNILMCPVRDSQGRRIRIEILGNTDPSDHSYIDHGRAQVIPALILMLDPVAQVTGNVYIYDMGNAKASHTTFYPPMEIVNLLKFFEKAVPIRHKEFHIVNLNSVLTVWLNMIIHVMSKKIQERVKIHDSLEDLHKHVDPALLPTVLGGKVPVEEMIELWNQKMVKSRDMILGMSDMRLVGNCGGEEVETGSFRKLTID